jgi:four helix bundle protein
MSQADELRQRTRMFALRAAKLADALPHKPSAFAIAKQLARSGTSAAANYRAACLARSKAEFIAKQCIVVEEMDETLNWLEMTAELRLVRPQGVAALTDEARQLTAIFVAARKTARGGRK